MSGKYCKHSYTIELTGNFRPANLPADDDWTLNASYIDKIFMRHKLSYGLFRQMGRYDIAPQSGNVEVWQDNEMNMLERVWWMEGDRYCFGV